MTEQQAVDEFKTNPPDIKYVIWGLRKNEKTGEYKRDCAVCCDLVGLENEKIRR